MVQSWMDRSSLRNKATLFVLMVTVSALLLIAGVGVYQMQRLVNDDGQRTVRAVAQGISHAAELALAVRDEQELTRLANGAMQDQQFLLIAIYDANGKLLAKSARTPPLWDAYAHGTLEANRLLLNEQPVALGTTENEFAADAALETPAATPKSALPPDKKVVGRVVVGLSNAAARQALQRQVQLTALATALVTGLALALVYGMVGAWTRRLNNLLLGSERIAHGDFTLRIDEGRRDEIGRLSGAYEQMRQAVQQRAAELRAFNDTLQQQVAERTRSLEDALHAAQAADQAKSRFLATMSHEIRTPLNGVVGMVDLLRGTPLNEQQQRYAQIARTSADSLLSVINDILDFSKIEAGRMELDAVAFDLHTMVEDVAETTALAATRKGLELSCCIEPETPAQVVGDQGRLRQILINLLNNAVKFTERGQIIIRVALARRDTQGVHLLISVTDSGIGIPADRQERLFQSFSQVDTSTTRKYGGTGLGLAISKRLAELMDGSIGVESTPGQGSKFWFTVQLQTARVLKPAAPSQQHHDIRDLRVLAVDDNAVNREILQRQLTAWDIAVETAPDGPTALGLLTEAQRRGQPYDLAILDWHMPAMDGLQLAQAIRGTPGLRQPALVMLTSIDDHTCSAELRAIGFGGYMVKPVRQSRLYDTIVTAVHPHPPAPEPAVAPQPHATLAPGAPVGRAPIHVLLAEDNEINQMVALEILTRAGFTCDIVDNGRSACAAVWSEKRYHVVLMDCQMPEMDGFAATRAIRQREMERGRPAHQPIIALTANAIKGDREACLAAGMDDYISKPINPDELLKAIAGAVARWPQDVPPAPPVRALPVPDHPGTPSAAGLPAAAAMRGVSKALADFLQTPGAGPTDLLTPEPPAPDAAAPPVDIQDLYERCLKNVDFAQRILAKFQERIGSDLTTLTDALAADKLDEAAKLAHSLKGSAANLSATAVRMLAAEIEHLCRSGQGDLSVALPRLQTEVTRCLEYIPVAIAGLSTHHEASNTAKKG